MKAVCGLTWEPIAEDLSEDTGTADQLRSSNSPKQRGVMEKQM